MTKHITRDTQIRAVIGLLHEVSEQFARLAQELADRAATHPTDLMAISVLARHRAEPLTVSRLGDQLNLSRGATTSLVDRLERAGHVERIRDHTDRRRIYVQITPAAEATAGSVLSDFLERTADALGDYGEVELAQIRRFLADVLAALTGSQPAAIPSTSAPSR